MGLNGAGALGTGGYRVGQRNLSRAGEAGVPVAVNMYAQSGDRRRGRPRMASRLRSTPRS